MAKKMRLVNVNDLVLEDLLVMDSDYVDEFASGVRKVMKEIRKLPIVDAELVVRAEWVWKEEEKPRLGENPTLKDYMKVICNPYAPDEMWHCSHCGQPAIAELRKIKWMTYSRLQPFFESYKPRRCPCCDAMMRED